MPGPGAQSDTGDPTLGEEVHSGGRAGCFARACSSSLSAIDSAMSWESCWRYLGDDDGTTLGGLGVRAGTNTREGSAEWPRLEALGDSLGPALGGS
jgi:hypothetical protein